MNNHTECLRGIRRPSRLGAVWLSFRTNWTLWPIPILVAIVMSLNAVPVWYDYFQFDTLLSPPQPMPLPTATVGKVNRRLVQKDGHLSVENEDVFEAKPEWDSLRSLTVDKLERCPELWVEGKMPRLESISLWSLTAEQLTKLCRLYDLQALKLLDLSLTGDSWQALCDESQLRYLELTDVPTNPIPGADVPDGLRRIKDRPTVEWPPHLQTLYYEDERGASSERLQEWRRLARLEQLSTHLLPRDDQQAEEIIDTLKTYPALKQLYVLKLHGSRDSEQVFHESFARLKRAASKAGRFPIRIHAGREYHFDRYGIGQQVGRTSRAMTILGLELLVTLILTLHLSGVCLTNNAVLTPGFLRANVGPVIVGFAGSAILSFELLRQADCSLDAAVGFCGLSTLGFVVTVRVFRWISGLSGFQLPGINQAGLLIVFMQLPATVFPTLVVFIPEAFDQLLGGHFPWINVLLLVATLGGIYDLIAWHVGLRRSLEDQGAADITLNIFDIKGLKSWANQVQAIRHEQGQRSPLGHRLAEWMMRRGDLLREQQLKRLRRGQHDRLALWKIASQDDSRARLWRAVFGIALVLSPLLISHDASTMGFGRLLLFLAVTSTSVVILSREFASLVQCLPMLTAELLRPTARKEWRRTWFQGVGIRSVFLVAAVVANGWVWLYCDRSGMWSFIDGILLTFLLVGCVSALFGMVMLALTYLSEFRFRSSLVSALMLLICLLSFVVLFLAKPLLTELLPNYRHLDGGFVSMLILFNLSAWLLAALMCGLAWRRWWSWELGDL